MYASPTEHQGVSSVQTILADADEDPTPARVDTRNPDAACLGADVAMRARSSSLPGLGHTFIAGPHADDLVGTPLTAAPIIANARAGSAPPSPAPATGYSIEGALA